MLRDIVRFEWRYHTRQISFVAAVVIFFGFGVAFTATGFGPDNVNVDSPYSIAQSIGLLSLFSLFVLAVFCANAVVRDRETQMEEIVFTTSVEKLPFLLGRFTGSFLAAFTAFSACALGMYAVRFLPLHDADRLGSANPLHYLWALLVLALPNLLFGGVVLFALSTITRSVLASYAGSVLLYVLYFVAAAATNSPLMASSVPGGSDAFSYAALIDPFGLSAFFDQTRHWTPAVRNTRLVALTGTFLVNRLLVLGASLAILGVVYRLFSFRLGVRRQSRRFEIESGGPAAALLYQTVPAAERGDWPAYISAVRMELRTFLFSRPVAAMLVLWAALAAFEIVSDVANNEYGSASYPTASLLFATLVRPLSIIATILVVYTSAEMIWRERTLRIAGILHATPASNAVFVTAKSTALVALVAALAFAGLAAGAIIQLARGWPVDPLLLASFAWFAAAPLVLFALAAVVIQTLSPQKYFGMLLVLVLGILALGMTRIEHPLLRFAATPPLEWSQFNGFGATRAFHWYVLYWTAFVALALLLAIARWRHTRMRTTRIGRVLATALTLLVIASGSFIFFTHESAGDVPAWQAAYENKYKAFASMPQPRIRKVHAQVDLHARSYRVRGSYVIANESNRAIDRVLIAVRRDAQAAQVSIDGAKLVSHDARFGQHVFALALAPNARTTLRFDITDAQRGLAADPSLNENGTFLMSHRVFPTVGYRAGYELDDPRERRRRGLPPLTASMSQPEIASAEWVDFDVTVTAPRDQIVVAPGTLVERRTSGRRTTSRFRSEAPIPNQFIIAAARYAVTRATHGDVAVEVYHHPAHTQNVERIIRAARDTLRYCEENFGPYPHRHLRIAEVSAQLRGFSGFAQPGVVFLGENRGFLIDARDERRLDLVYRRVAHEVAHQWWGYQLVAAPVPGATMLTESLTKYTELMLLARAYGADAVRESLTYELDLYLSGRTSETGAEPPLARSGDQAYLYYRKGALVMHALADLLGERAVNAALRNLLRERQPTTAHLLAQLRAVAPAAQHALIDQWMNDVVLYDFKLASASSRRLADGRYAVTLRVDASKQRADDTKLPLHESIDVALFAAGEELYRAKHPLRDGMQQFEIVVNKEPSIAAVDPYLSRIDRNRFDNEARLVAH